MKKTICDKCGKELRDDEALEITVEGKVEEYFDLCPECREAFIDWLAGKCPYQVHQEKDPVYGGGEKNDKNGYTIYQLEKMLHKWRKTIKSALSDMKKEPSAWMQKGRPVVKWFLGDKDLATLKKRLGVK